MSEKQKVDSSKEIIEYKINKKEASSPREKVEKSVESENIKIIVEKENAKNS